MDSGSVLLDILVVLIAAKVAAEVAERVAVPAVVGEILAGILIGPSVLGMVEGDEVLRVLGEIGVILLLLEVGLDMDLAELGAVGRMSLQVALVGVAVPFALGWVAMTAAGHGGDTALFMGAALTATSVGITARVFSDLRALATVEARTVLGAAVADDVLGLVILTVVVRMVEEGSVSILSVAGIVGLAVAFLVVTTAVGVRVGPALFRHVHDLSRSSGTLVALALAFTLGTAELASAARLAPIVGAFVAGLALAGSAHADRIRRELRPVGHLFIPVFFLQIGIDARVEEFAKPEVLGLAGLLLAAAVVGKLASPLGAWGGRGDRVTIGLGMLPRGEVGLIFATIGLRDGVLGPRLYAALLLVVLVTTLVTPPLLRWRMLRVRSRQRAATAVRPEPAGGWLAVTDGVVDLVPHDATGAPAEPPDHLALHLALRAARLAATARPGPRLLDWLSRLGEGPLRWDRDATQELFGVLGQGNARSWRLLEASGVLDRALPRLAEAVRRRRADPFELDPTQQLRWSLVERVRELAADPVAAAETAQLAHTEWLLLAALILDAAGDDAAPVATARDLAKRLDLGASAEQEIALLVGQSGLLRGAAKRGDGLTEDAVLQVAAYLDTPERARALYLLSLAVGDLDPVARRRLDDLYGLVQQALEHPELTGREARNLVERRRAEAVRLAGSRQDVAERIAAAPRAYLLARDSADVARHAALVEPVPQPGRTRVSVLPVTAANGSGVAQWRVEVACRDRPGVLARVTGVLHEAGLDVLDAVVATWPDGGALESFRVSARPGAADPDPDVLRAAIEEAFDRPVASPPVPDAEVRFEDEGSPWYTRGEVRAPDRPGLLHALAAALAEGGADVHAARVTTVEGVAADQFELTDRNGRKLDEATKAAVCDAVARGVTPSRRGVLGQLLARTTGTRPKQSGDRTETGVS